MGFCGPGVTARRVGSGGGARIAVGAVRFSGSIVSVSAFGGDGQRRTGRRSCVGGAWQWAPAASRSGCITAESARQVQEADLPRNVQFVASYVFVAALELGKYLRAAETVWVA